MIEGMDLQTLAQVLVRSLAPFLPFLTKAGEAASEEAGKKVAEQVFDRVKEPLAARPAAREAVETLADAPGDGPARAALEAELVQVLGGDSALARELFALARPWIRSEGGGAVAYGPGATAAGKGGIAVGRVGGDLHIGQLPGSGSTEGSEGS